MPKKDASYYLIRWVVLIAAGLAVYYQTFSFGFVFDDDWFIVSSPYIKDLKRLSGVFDQFPFTRTMGFLSFALNYALHQLDPFGYHLFNFLIHVIAAALVWGVSGLLIDVLYPVSSKGRDAVSKGVFIRQAPFLIALLFLVHPGQTQAVSYISQRFESMATVFYLSAVYCYLRARLIQDQKRVLFFVLTGILGFLGILTKEIVATLPLMLLALEALIMPFVKHRGDRSMIAAVHSKKIIFILAGAVLVFSLVFMALVRTDLRIFLQVTESESHDGDVLSSGRYLLTQLRVFLTFARLLILPIHQNLDYDYPMSTGLLEPPLTLVGLLVIAGMILTVIRLRHRYPLISFGIAWMLIAFSINLAPRANVIFEHKLYLISFGFLIVLVSSLNALSISDRVRMALVIVLAVGWGVLSYQRNQVWQNNLTLWQDVIKKSPHKHRSNINLGLSYMEAGHYEEALFYLNRFMSPLDLKSYLARGAVYERTGNYLKALEDFDHVIKLDPKNADAYIRRAKVHKKQGQYEQALKDLGAAIELDPRNDKPYIDRSIIWMMRQETALALNDLNKALEIDPSSYGARINIAGVYSSQGQYEEAIEELNKAQGLKDSDPRLYKNRALCYLSLGRQQEALRDMQRVLALDPADIQVREKYRRLIDSR